MKETPIMLLTHRTTLALAVSVVALVTPAVANAQAFYLQEQSARGAGRAFSGEVADTGPASLWWNPAAIAGQEHVETTLTASAILPHGDVVDKSTVIVRPAQAPALVGGNPVTHDPISNGVLPSGAIAVPLNDRVAFGLAVSAPYNFTTRYPADSWARYSAQTTRLRTIDIQPSVGVALTDWLRVGAGLNVEYTSARLGNALPNLSAALPDGAQELRGDGWDFGWSVGVQLHQGPLTVGISYKSAIEHTLGGHATTSGLLGPLAGQNGTVDGLTAQFNTPAQIIVGARVAVTPKLTLNGQFVRSTWGKFDAISITGPVTSTIPENYRSTYSIAGGIDYAVTPKLTLRTGVQRTLTPTQDGERDARVPDSNRWNFSGGGSYQLTSRFTVDAAASYIDFADAPIDRITAAYVGTPVQTPVLTQGELRDAHAVVLSLGGRYRF